MADRKHTVIVFGSSGFVGTRFINIFRDKYEIIPLSKNSFGNGKDFTVYEETLSILRKYRPDVVLNLAGKSYHKTNDDALIYESNILVQLNLHEAVNQLNLDSKIVFCSSSAVYKSSVEPIGENAPCLPLNTYARAKYIQERIGLSYHPKHNIVIARLFNVIGPCQDKNFFIPKVIDCIIKYKNKEISAVQLKTLNAIRDFIYIDDVCTAIGALIDQGVSGEIYNVCSGKDMSISNIIDSLKEILEISDIPIYADMNYVKEGINYQVGLNEKLCKLGWSSVYNIKDSLKKIIREDYGY